MSSSPYSSSADFWGSFTFSPAACGRVPYPWPQATHGQKGLFMWPQTNLLIVAALRRPSWPSKLWQQGLLCQLGKCWVLRGSQRGLLRWVCLVLVNFHHLATCCGSILPWLSSVRQWKALQVRSNIHRIGLIKHCTSSGIFWGQTLLLGRLKQIQLRLIQLHP